jgi:hypothetical protein
MAGTGICHALLILLVLGLLVSSSGARRPKRGDHPQCCLEDQSLSKTGLGAFLDMSGNFSVRKLHQMKARLAAAVDRLRETSFATDTVQFEEEEPMAGGRAHRGRRAARWRYQFPSSEAEAYHQQQPEQLLTEQQLLDIYSQEPTANESPPGTDEPEAGEAVTPEKREKIILDWVSSKATGFRELMEKGAGGQDCPSSGDLAYLGCALLRSNGSAICQCTSVFRSCYQPSLLAAVRSDEDMKAFLAGRCSVSLWVDFMLFSICGLLVGICIGICSCAGHDNVATRQRAKSALKRRSAYVQDD